MASSNPLFAFLGTSVDSRFALAQLERVGLSPALVVDTKELPEELYNTEWDFVLVASYGKLLPKELLAVPKCGFLNIHPSLLPKFRGPSPYVSAILADERQTGVSLMVMEEKMDAGPILAQARIEIDEADWPPRGLELSEMLFTEGVNLLAEALPGWLEGTLQPVPQDEAAATYTRKYTDQDALVDLGGEPRAQLLKIRAFDKSPRAHFINEQGRRVVVIDAHITDGRLELLTVLPEGKKEMSYEAYRHGRKPLT